jgi:hypothetical protein
MNKKIKMPVPYYSVPYYSAFYHDQIRGSLGFDVQGLDDPPDGYVYKWVQVIYTNASTVGNSGPYLDDGTNQNWAGASSYYPPFYPAATPPNFGDTSGRPQGLYNITWKATLFLTAWNKKCKKLKFYDQIVWGWERTVTEQKPET